MGYCAVYDAESKSVTGLILTSGGIDEMCQKVAEGCLCVGFKAAECPGLFHTTVREWQVTEPPLRPVLKHVITVQAARFFLPDGTEMYRVSLEQPEVLGNVQVILEQRGAYPVTNSLTQASNFFDITAPVAGEYKVSLDIHSPYYAVPLFISATAPVNI